MKDIEDMSKSEIINHIKELMSKIKEELKAYYATKTWKIQVRRINEK